MEWSSGLTGLEIVILRMTMRGAVVKNFFNLLAFHFK